MTASTTISIDGPTGGVVSNFPLLEGTGAGNSTQDSIELEIYAGRVSSRLKKNLMAGASL